MCQEEEGRENAKALALITTPVEPFHLRTAATDPWLASCFQVKRLNMSRDQSQSFGVLSCLKILFLTLVAPCAACASVGCLRIYDRPTVPQNQQLLDENVPFGPVVSTELDIYVVSGPVTKFIERAKSLWSHRA